METFYVEAMRWARHALRAAREGRIPLAVVYMGHSWFAAGCALVTSDDQRRHNRIVRLLTRAQDAIIDEMYRAEAHAEHAMMVANRGRHA